MAAPFLFDREHNHLWVFSIYIGFILELISCLLFVSTFL